jgi:thioredoxin 1
VVGKSFCEIKFTMEPMTFKKIKSQDFIERIVLNKVDALVKIVPQWNAAGQLLSNTLHEMATVYQGKVDFFQLEYEEESAFTKTYRVEGVPTLLFFKKGTLVDKISGLIQRTIISTKLDQLVNPK